MWPYDSAWGQAIPQHASARELEGKPRTSHVSGHPTGWGSSSIPATGRGSAEALHGMNGTVSHIKRVRTAMKWRDSFQERPESPLIRDGSRNQRSPCPCQETLSTLFPSKTNMNMLDPKQALESFPRHETPNSDPCTCRDSHVPGQGSHRKAEVGSFLRHLDPFLEA